MNKLAEKIQIIDRNILADSRGYFLKLLTGKEEFLPTYTGEIYLTVAEFGEAKGGHYHSLANEWFTLILGQCDLILVDTVTNEQLEIPLSDSDPKTIFVPRCVAHIFKNRGKDKFMLLAYTDQYFDPQDTIIWDKF